MIKKIKLFILTAVFCVYSSLPSFAMPDESDLISQGPIQLKSRFSFDERRERFYSGTNLSALNFDGEPSAYDHIDKHKVAFTTTVERKKSKERLLRGSSAINNILYSVDLLEAHKGKLFGDTDRRVPSPSHEEHPWHTHGHLLSIYYDKYDKEAMYIGSGVLIGKRTVLTAAHNLYDFETKRKADIVVFYPGKNGEEWLCEGISSQTFIPPEYMEREESDIGAVILDEDFESERQSKALGSLTVAVIPPQKLIDEVKRIHVTGYPGGVIINGELNFLDGTKMFTMLGDIKKIDHENGKIFYDADTSAGQSGGAVWYTDGEDHICCGVHIEGGRKATGNIGTFINGKNGEHILDWLKSDGVSE